MQFAAAFTPAVNPSFEQIGKPVRTDDGQISINQYVLDADGLPIIFAVSGRPADTAPPISVDRVFVDKFVCKVGMCAPVELTKPEKLEISKPPFDMYKIIPYVIDFVHVKVNESVEFSPDLTPHPNSVVVGRIR